MTCRICQSYTSEVVNATYGRPEGLCLACGAGYLDGFNAGREKAFREMWANVLRKEADDQERYVSHCSDTVVTKRFRDRAAQLRAWAGES